MTAATYDGNGLRASTTTTPAGRPLPPSITSGTQCRSLAHGLVQRLHLRTGGAPAEQVNLATGTVTYLITDALGSVRGTVSSGTLTGTTSYDAWGNPQTSGGLTATTPFGYAGGYTDPNGLIYLINRYYDPATGQFISVDPDLSQTHQPYAYTDDNPVSQPTRTAIPLTLTPTSEARPRGV